MELRAYYFGNMYLSSIQQGIQAAHVTADMFVKYTDTHSTAIYSRDLLHSWAKEHKTMILLNAGYGASIKELTLIFASNLNPYPWSVFHESEDALNRAVTSIGIILPEKIYRAAALMRKYPRTDDDLIMSPRDIIWDSGELVITPFNNWGISTNETIEWEYTKWEVELAEKLNDFGLAR